MVVMLSWIELLWLTVWKCEDGEGRISRKEQESVSRFKYFLELLILFTEDCY